MPRSADPARHCGMRKGGAKKREERQECEFLKDEGDEEE
jgi:hypothetical protein